MRSGPARFRAGPLTRATSSSILRRLAPWAVIGYLLLAALANSVLGIVLAFAPPSIYPASLHPADTALLNRAFGDLLAWAALAARAGDEA